MQIDPVSQSAMLAATRRTSRAPWLPLLSALLELAQGEAELLRHSERGWASVTFSGTRHTVVLAFTGSASVRAGESFIDALPEHEFTIPRQIVAEAAVVRVDQALLPTPKLEVEVQLLLLEDC